MPEKELIQAGISALQSGDRARAKSLFSQVAKEYPNSEQGWYFLGLSVTQKDQQEFCWKRVLKLNPNNLDAKKRLALLSKPEPAPEPADWLTQLAPDSDSNKPDSKSVAPFSPYEDLRNDFQQEKNTTNPPAQKTKPPTKKKK